MRITLKMVNNELAALGIAERLVQGRGYLYFAEGDAATWPQSSVMVPRLNCLSLEQWISEHAALKAARITRKET